MCSELLRLGHNVYAIIREKSNTSSLHYKNRVKFHKYNSVNELKNFIKEKKIEGVIHLASCYLKKHSPDDIESLINSNVLFGSEIIEASVNANVSWFVNTGTFWQHFNKRIYSPVNLYAATKQAFMDILTYYKETTNINIVTVKLNDTYGPDDTRPKIFNLWERIASTGEEINMTAGEQLIDIVYIDDVVDAYVQLLDLLDSSNSKMKLFESYIISSNEIMTLKKMAEIYQEETGCILKINWGKLPYSKREFMKPYAEGTAIPGWSPKVSFKDGIKKCIGK